MEKTQREVSIMPKQSDEDVLFGVNSLRLSPGARLMPLGVVIEGVENHIRGVWGDIEDANMENEHALRNGGTVISQFETPGKEPFLIVSKVSKTDRLAEVTVMLTAEFE